MGTRVRAGAPAPQWRTVWAVRDFAAFLRGINVTGHRVKGPVLCAVFEDRSGCRAVSTFRASGNVVFDADPEPEAGLTSPNREGPGGGARATSRSPSCAAPTEVTAIAGARAVRPGARGAVEGQAAGGDARARSRTRRHARRVLALEHRPGPAGVRRSRALLASSGRHPGLGSRLEGDRRGARERRPCAPRAPSSRSRRSTSARKGSCAAGRAGCFAWSWTRGRLGLLVIDHLWFRRCGRASRAARATCRIAKKPRPAGRSASGTANSRLTARRSPISASAVRHRGGCSGGACPGVWPTSAQNAANREPPISEARERRSRIRPRSRGRRRRRWPRGRSRRAGPSRSRTQR